MPPRERPTPNTILIEKDDGVARITLNRPDRRNALSPLMATELDEALSEIEPDPEVRVILLRGAGGNFCSGGDLSPDPSDTTGRQQPSGSPAAITLDIMNRVYGAAIRRLHHFPKPIIARVDGTAAGAGANLALACDLVYATPSARFAQIFVKRGLSLDCGGSWLLPRLVGLQRAKELAFFGDWIDAERAAALGLVTEIFPAERIDRALDEKLSTLASRPPIALGLIKQGLHRALTTSMDDALEAEAVAQATCSATQDMAEGVAAFLEKRDPKFTGR